MIQIVGFVGLGAMGRPFAKNVLKAGFARSQVADTYLHGRGSKDLSWVYYHVLRDALDLGHAHDVPLPGAAICMQALAHSLRKSQPVD